MATQLTQAQKDVLAVLEWLVDGVELHVKTLRDNHYEPLSEGQLSEHLGFLEKVRESLRSLVLATDPQVVDVLAEKFDVELDGQGRLVTDVVEMRREKRGNSSRS